MVWTNEQIDATRGWMNRYVTSTRVSIPIAAVTGAHWNSRLRANYDDNIIRSFVVETEAQLNDVVWDDKWTNYDDNDNF